VGKIVNIKAYAARRKRRRQAVMLCASLHPALRWIASEDRLQSHRRTPSGTACGMSGPLELAQPNLPLCRACYRQTGP
jgi:hypothetical protein